MTGWIIAGGIILLIIVLLAVPVRALFSYDKDLQLRVKYLFFTFYSIPSKPKKKKANKDDEGGKADKADDNSAETPEEALKKLAEEVAAEGSKSSSDKPDEVAEKTSSISAELKQDKPEKAEKVSADKKSDEKPKKKKKKKKPSKIPTLDELITLLRALADSCGKPFKKLFKRIKIVDFRYEAVCGGEDAAKAALNFGRTNLLVSNLLGACNMVFTVKYPYVDINVDFQSEETVTKISGVVKLSALAALAFLFTLIGRIGWRVLTNGTIKDYIARLTGGGSKKKKSKKAKKKAK